ncbi:MAG: HNH endonuclease signature motif containing protein [Actinomycetia bacterium]|nr:HNH endonuclease signature motif containing protein [Actinomycetes bacterium]
MAKAITASHPYCGRCGVTQQLQVHHTVPLAYLLANGEDPYDLDLCEVLCARCHRQAEPAAQQSPNPQLLLQR